MKMILDVNNIRFKLKIRKNLQKYGREKRSEWVRKKIISPVKGGMSSPRSISAFE